jgi:hypothetical protein
MGLLILSSAQAVQVRPSPVHLYSGQIWSHPCHYDLCLRLLHHPVTLSDHLPSSIRALHCRQQSSGLPPSLLAAHCRHSAPSQQFLHHLLQPSSSFHHCCQQPPPCTILNTVCYQSQACARTHAWFLFLAPHQSTFTCITPDSSPWASLACATLDCSPAIPPA